MPLLTVDSTLLVQPQQLDQQKGRWTTMSGDFLLKAAATLELPWAIRTTGTPTASDYVTAARDGIYRVGLAATVEAENNGLDFADLLCINEQGTGIFDFVVKPTRGGALASTDSYTFGLGSAYNADPDAITNSLFFKMKAATTNWYVESDDGTHEVAATDTGIPATDATWFTLRIDMRDIYHCKFFIAVRGAQSGTTPSTTVSFKRCLPNTTFDMSSMTGGLQPILVVIKASSARTHSFDFDAYNFKWKKLGS